jgi:hypothetical protein
MKYELSEQIINNILIFLDRCEVKGFKEINAMQEIINNLNSPINEVEEIEKK